MKSKQLGLKSTMQLPEKKPLVSVVPLQDLEQKVSNLHQKELVRLSLDVHQTMYKQVKMRQLTLGYKTTREYLLSLIEQDLL